MSMSSFGFGASDPFSDLFNRFFGTSPASSPPAVQRVPIGRMLTESSQELLNLAARRSLEDGTSDLDTEHLLWAATKVEPARGLLARAGADPDALASRIAEVLPREAGEPSAEPGLTPAAKRTLATAYARSRASGVSYIGPEHILGALLADGDTGAARLLGAQGQDIGKLEGLTEQAARPGGAPGDDGGRPATTLDEYGRDLTDEAKAGKLDPVVGRAEEIEQTVEILSRRSKNNPVLIGEPGVGKTAIVEGLAQRIVAGEVPNTLKDKRVVALDLSAMVAGAQYRGQFEERLKKVIEDVQQARGDIILFIDELHTVVGAGASGESSMDAGNMLKPALARGELHVVGATTIDEYRKYVEKDAALERRFQPVMVPEPSVEETVQILEGLRDAYEAHHQVRFADGALTAAAELSDRYVSDRFLPDKAIDVMDQAGARVRLRSASRSTEVVGREDRIAKLRREQEQAVAAEDYARAGELKREIAEAEGELAGIEERREGVVSVTADDIADVISRRTGIPVSQLTAGEKERLLRLEEEMHARIVGQDEAVTAVSRAVRRNRAGMGDPDRPVGSFLFLGPTGVGKTELAKTLAELLFGEENRMIRFDMSEFQEKHTVARLVGAPPGYVGYEEAGQLTEKVRRQPYSVVLFDEVEKAHPDVFNTLLQILDDGRLTDGQGRTVDFRHCVVIMTSNIGAHRILDHKGDVSDLKDELMQELRGRFLPEFLNRIDEIIVFHGLTEDDLSRIVDHLLAQSERRVHAQGMTLKVTEAAKKLLIAHGHQPEFGARPLRRTIQAELDNRVADLLLGGEADPGDTIVADVVDDSLHCTVDKSGTARPAEASGT
ncbi:ATP-dependent Clp protease ATP-binding subunit [Streptomyces violaceoruber]|uniref:Chaperone n=2 Tax=Streptomyces TaxID=1883 RepID=Q93IZ7_STRCO|nr:MULTISPECIES: ATP-dependent Clp protease ATP-binding subunit [Streptomyces]MBQ0948781.1 ATP-dependent Clp protease ATP-binding subunit [Streptomyces sp. RK76]MCW8122933.1 ATP-dependent Clp protease ATP-binding subunit [Streptomyces anthocyanicus]MDX2924411.1 ATP-dependent Clp protease ATP-binding subunit [Streptomyces sp. NRRL_B-16638]MDX3315632.1 ATP-dependent Clp protease ATP-binding subunit [Streptomyces sp. ME03-5684b]MDX3344176.1 ATP-dependent Clp protease ATP-binding subunit [Streptom